MKGCGLMHIYTSYFANIRKLPEGLIPISIALKSPPGYVGLTYPALAPTWSILAEWKDCHNEELYVSRFYNEILGKLDQDSVYESLKKLSRGLDVVLICFEKRGSFCHRNLVAYWFKLAGRDVKEL